MLYSARAKAHPLSSFARRMPYFRQKACISPFDIHTDLPGLAKHTAEPSVGLQPNVACEYQNGQAFLNGGARAMLPSQT